MILRREEKIDLILFFHGHGNAFSATTLRAKCGRLHTLDIAIFREAHHDFLIRDSIRRIPFSDRSGDHFGPTCISEFISDFFEFLSYYLEDPRMVRENVSKIGYKKELLREFIFDLLALESSEPLELHLEDCG